VDTIIHEAIQCIIGALQDFYKAVYVKALSKVLLVFLTKIFHNSNVILKRF